MIKEHCLRKEELGLFTLTDDPDEVAKGLLEGYKSRVKLEQDVIETV